MLCPSLRIRKKFEYPHGDLQSVIVAFPGHTHFRFGM